MKGQTGNLNRSPAGAGRRWVAAATKPDVRGGKTGVSVGRCFSRDLAIGQMRHTAYGRRQRADGGRRMAGGGFSLVEVTVAIGIFAFVAVGVLGLLPAALKQRADSSREMRAVMIAEELFSSLQAAPSITNVTLRDGPGLGAGQNQTVNLLDTNTVVVGYPAQTSVPWFLWGGQRNVGTPDSAWLQGVMPPGAVANGIDTLARMTATNISGVPGLYRVTVQVRSPASVPLMTGARTNTLPVTFTSLFYSP
jgi:type II secretory pathway pseudopilin PulG